MTEVFELGTTAAGDPLAIDLEALIGAHACVAANSGGGKSGLIRKLLETTHGRVQHLVLDPEDEFYTLRERFDYVIAGGDGGDAPATVAGAPALARAALANGFSLIAQINDLGEGAADFIATFCDALISAPRELWRPLLVVVDEAQRFAPSTGGSEATAALKNLLQRGRKRGFTAVVASTRVSELHPGVRGLCRNWMLGLVGQALDRRTAAAQLGFGPSSAEAKELQSLEPRQFWGFGPAIARQPVLFRVGQVETTIVRSGQAKVPTPPAPEALREILAGLAAPAEKPVPPDMDRDPLAVSIAVERIAELEAEKAGLRAEVERLQGVDAECEGYNAGLTAIEQLLVAVRSGAAWPQLLQTPRVSQTAPAGPSGPDAEGAPPAAGGTPPAPPPAGAPDRQLGAERKPLALLAGMAPATLTDASWATLAGFKRKGGTWTTYRSRLRTAGLIEQIDGKWRATAAGVAAIGGEASDVPAPGLELVKFWAERVPGAGRMLLRLGQLYPEALEKDALAVDLNMAAKGGTFVTYLSRLRGNGLLEEKAGRIRLAPALMGDKL